MVMFIFVFALVAGVIGFFMHARGPMGGDMFGGGMGGGFGGDMFGDGPGPF